MVGLNVLKISWNIFYLLLISTDSHQEFQWQITESNLADSFKIETKCVCV